MSEERFRLMQDGLAVVHVEGPAAAREILHYALVYSRDGPVAIERRAGRRWKEMKPMDLAAHLSEEP